LRCSLVSLRDIEELLFERGVIVTYETVRRWCDKFGAGIAHRVKAVRRNPGSTWHLDEMFVTLRGEPHLLWRAVDEHGTRHDTLLQKRRDEAAAKRFFKRVLRSSPVPRKIVTDQLLSYPAAKAENPALANVKHVFVKAAARLNNRTENSHQAMRGFPDRNAHKHFSLASGRSGNTSHSSVIRCGPHSIANNSWQDSWPGAKLPTLPKIRPTFPKAMTRSRLSAFRSLS
jgi:putative transposase